MELRIKSILREKGLTIKDLADRMGMDPSNLASALKKGNPKLSMLIEVANAIGCDLTELFSPNAETANAPKGSSQALIIIDGEGYRLTKAKDAVKLPAYTDYAELRNNLKGFIQRAEKVDRKIRREEDSVKDNKPFSMMGMVEAFEVFSLLYVPETATFYLSLTYKNGKSETYAYDARCQYNDPLADDGSWETEMLYAEIRNDIEGAVKARIETEIE